MEKRNSLNFFSVTSSIFKNRNFELSFLQQQKQQQQQ